MRIFPGPKSRIRQEPSSFLLFWSHFFPCFNNIEIVALVPVMCTYGMYTYGMYTYGMYTYGMYYVYFRNFSTEIFLTEIFLT